LYTSFGCLSNEEAPADPLNDNLLAGNTKLNLDESWKGWSLSFPVVSSS